jgi:hypothetical protein
MLRVRIIRFHGSCLLLLLLAAAFLLLGCLGGSGEAVEGIRADLRSGVGPLSADGRGLPGAGQEDDGSGKKGDA